MDYAALAQQFGGSLVPSGGGQAPAQTAPWMARLSPEHQAKIQREMYEEGRKRLAELQGSISDAGPIMDDLNEFGRLNRENSTGSLWQQITPDKSIFRTGPSMEMAAIQSRLAPAQRQPGSGASSDRDVALFLRGLPSLENEGNTNKGIREDFERRYNAALEKANAMKQYLEQNGNLMGFDAEWAQRAQKPRAGATPLPPNPSAQSLQPGVVYDTPRGPAKWDGFKFNLVK